MTDQVAARIDPTDVITSTTLATAMKAKTIFGSHMQKEDNKMSNTHRQSRSLPFAPEFLRLVVLSVIATITILDAIPSHAQGGWLGSGHGVDIGSGPAGSDSYNAFNTTYSVTGGGTGCAPSGDQLHFTYMELPSGGNFRLIARIASFTGAAGSEVGLAVRQDLNASDSAGCVLFQPATGSSPTPNNLTYLDRNLQTSPSRPLSMGGRYA